MISNQVWPPIISGVPHHQKKKNLMQVEVIMITTLDDHDPLQLCFSIAPVRPSVMFHVDLLVPQHDQNCAELAQRHTWVL